MKLLMSLEDSALLIKCVTQKFANEAKEQKGRLLDMLLDTLGAIF